MMQACGAQLELPIVQPTVGRRVKHLVGGQWLSQRQMAKLAGVSVAAMSRRLKHLEPEEAVAKPKKQPHQEIPPGTPFGRLTVDRRGPNAWKNGSPQYYVRCACSPNAEPYLVAAVALLDGSTGSCGCRAAEQIRALSLSAAEDLTGQKFVGGRVEVVGRSVNFLRKVYRGRAVNNTLWLARCACGKTFEALAADLRSGRRKTCGCGFTRKDARKTKRRAPISTWRATPLSYRDITPKMEARLIRRSQAGDREAQTTLVLAHDAFLRTLAAKWGWHGLGAEFDDILQEARISFLRSLQTADPAKGSLITYAGKLASFKARRTVEQDSRTVRIPVHIQRHARNAARSGATTPEQIRELTGCTETSEDVAAFTRTRGRSMSLDAPVGDEGVNTLLDLQVDDRESPEDEAAESERREKLAIGLKNAMCGMDAREIDVLQRRAADETLEQIAQTYGVSRERIRQIEATAKKRLKLRAAGLRDLLAG